MMPKHVLTLDDIKEQLIIAKLKGHCLFATKGYTNGYVLITRIDDNGDLWVNGNEFLREDYKADVIKKYPGNFRLVIKENIHPWPQPRQI